MTREEALVLAEGQVFVSGAVGVIDQIIASAASTGAVEVRINTAELHRYLLNTSSCSDLFSSGIAYADNKLDPDPIAEELRKNGFTVSVDPEKEHYRYIKIGWK